jgi:hypothetical protein
MTLVELHTELGRFLDVGNDPNTPILFDGSEISNEGCRVVLRGLEDDGHGVICLVLAPKESE